MRNCNFVCSFPEYVLDRTIVITDGHEHKVSGYKLAKSSEYFKTKLKEIRTKEIEKCKKDDNKEIKNNELTKDSSTSTRRKRTKSVSDLEIEIITSSYNDSFGLEYVLSFIHNQDNLEIPALSLNNENFVSVVKAASFLKVPSLLAHCYNHVDKTLNDINCWDFYSKSDDIKEINKELYNLIENAIAEHFILACNNDKMLQLNFDKLKDFLKNDALNCKDELLLLPIISRWVEYDKDKRISNFLDLFKCIRFGRLNLQDIEVCSTNFFVKTFWNECENILKWSQLTTDEINNQKNGFSAEVTVLISYMRQPRLPREAIIVVGGWEGNQDDPNFGPSKAIQVFNNRANLWKRLVSDKFALDEGHAYSGCVVLDQKVYVIGGYVPPGPTQTLKVFDILTMKWKYLSPMHEKRNYISASSLKGFIYAIGGHNGKIRLNSVEKYDPIHNHWTLIAPMKQVRSDAGSDSLGDKLYVCGGFDGHNFYPSVEAYNSITNQWTNVSPMHNIRSGVSMITFDRYLFAIGGNDGLQRLRTVERYDPETDAWKGMPAMIRQRSNFCVSVIENEIYVMGGWSDETNSTIALVEKWEPGMGNSWKPVQQLFMPASANCCCSIKGLSAIQEFLN